MSKSIILLITILTAAYVWGEEKLDTKELVLKISVLSSNIVLLNGQQIGPNQLAEKLSSAQKENGVVWYYREDAESEPPPAATQVIQMVIDNKLPISMSTKSDFSDYVGEHGESIPR